MVKKNLLLLGLLLSTGMLINAQTEFHVSPNSTKNGNGKPESPFNTIQAAQAAVAKINKNMTEDIIVYLYGGTYNLKSPLEFKEKDSGTNGYSIIYKAYNNEVPLLNGGVKVTGWEQVGGNIYKATLNRDSKLRTLFVNGKRMRMAGAEEPLQGLGSWGSFEVKGNESWALGAGSSIDGIKFSAKDIRTFRNPEDVELIQFNVWTEKILCIRQIEQIGDTIILKLQQPYGAIATNLAWAGRIKYDGTFVVRNAYELLDSPGEFYFDRQARALYYYSNGEDMSTAEVIAPLSDGLISIKGTSTSSRVSNISFEGISFSFDHWQLVGVDGSHGFAGVQSLGLAHKYIPDGNWHPTEYNSTNVPRGTIQVQNAENINFIKNRFVGLSSASAINLVNDVQNCKVSGNYFHDLLGNAVNVGHPQHYKIGDGELFGEGVEGLCEYNIVSNNYIRNVSLDFRQVEGITAFFVANHKIEHNDVAGTPYGAIALGWWWADSKIPPSEVAKNNSISFNKAGDSHLVLDDGGTIYTLGKQPGTLIEGNYLYNGPRSIYPDDGSAYLTIKRNVVNNRPGKIWWLNIWNNRIHDILVQDNFVKNNLLRVNGTNITIENTQAFYTIPFSDEAMQIIDSAGIQDEFKSIIPPSEPERINLYPKEFVEEKFH